MAGREGFEPSVEFYPDNRLAGGPDRPLRHLPTILAEGEGFEPPVRFDPTVVFKTTAIVHSAIPPRFRNFASAGVYHAHLLLVNGRNAVASPCLFHCSLLPKTGPRLICLAEQILCRLSDSVVGGSKSARSRSQHVLNDLRSVVTKSINCFIGSYRNRQRAIQHLKPSVDYKVPTVQKSQLKEIPAR